MLVYDPQPPATRKVPADALRSDEREHLTRPYHCRRLRHDRVAPGQLVELPEELGLSSIRSGTASITIQAPMHRCLQVVESATRLWLTAARPNVLRVSARCFWA